MYAARTVEVCLAYAAPGERDDVCLSTCSITVAPHTAADQENSAMGSGAATPERRLHQRKRRANGGAERTGAVHTLRLRSAGRAASRPGAIGRAQASAGGGTCPGASRASAQRARCCAAAFMMSRPELCTDAAAEDRALNQDVAVEDKAVRPTAWGGSVVTVGAGDGGRVEDITETGRRFVAGRHCTSPLMCSPCQT